MSCNKPGIIRNSCSSKNSSADNLLSLYNKIPDYSEVKSLSQADFIRALENLKEEFRRCRASLYYGESGQGHENGLLSSEDEEVVRRTSALNIRDPSPAGKIWNCPNNLESTLEIRGSQSQLHRNPSALSGGGGNNYAINYLNYNKPSRSLSFNFGERKPAFGGNEDGGIDGIKDFESDDDEDSQNSSKWSSNGDIGHFKEFKEYVPPKNIEKRLLERKSINQSAPSLLSAPENERSTVFKAHPVPSHVYKPLYEFIMLKNQRRSQKVREQSKQKLMAQVKPFTFTRDRDAKAQSTNTGLSSVSNTERAQFHNKSQSASLNNKEVLNNAKPIRSRKSCTHHTNNFRMVNHFRANPAPPRTKALLSAMRLKEQQEYRELKKRLRAEALMKNATLPPSMAARDKRIKMCNAKLDAIIQEYQNSSNSARDRMTNRNVHSGRGDQSTDVDFDDTAFTDEDRLSEDSFRYLNSPATLNNASEGVSARNKMRQRAFTSFGKSRHSSAASGIFECTSNDNLASRLRIQATRKKETERIKREEEELLKLMRNESRRKKLRDSHIAAWRRAHSYSSSQDIAMRRQLRAAAEILERESFVRDMSTMLSRVRSAPLLLEGVRERRFEPCKKHKEEFLQLGDRSLSNNKLTTPRFTPRSKTTNSSNWFLDRYGFGDDNEPSRSETVAVAEGSLTNSDHDTDDNEYSDNDANNKTHKSEHENSPTFPSPKKQFRISEDTDVAPKKDNQ